MLDASIEHKIRDQLQLYREKSGSYGLPDAHTDRFKISLALWWEDYGADGPELQRFAIRILSQGCSSNCLEQLWSVYSHIASKKRNRLGVHRANDLVFVSSNLRMLCKGMVKKADSFTEWEQAQQDSEVDPLQTAEILEDLEGIGEEEPQVAEDFTKSVEILLHPIVRPTT